MIFIGKGGWGKDNAFHVSRTQQIGHLRKMKRRGLGHLWAGVWVPSAFPTGCLSGYGRHTQGGCHSKWVHFHESTRPISQQIHASPSIKLFCIQVSAAHTHICMHAYMQTHTQHKHVHICTCKHVHTYSHACTHRDTHARCLSTLRILA